MKIKSLQNYILMIGASTLLAGCTSPFMFLNNDGVEVYITVPDNIKVDSDIVGALYNSNRCKTLSAGDGDWGGTKKNKTYFVEKVSERTYKAKVYYEDNSYCNWQLEQIGWSLEYIDAGKIYSKAAKANGGSGGDGGGDSISITKVNDKIPKESIIFEEKVYTIKQNLIPEIMKPSKTYNRDKYGIYLNIDSTNGSRGYFNPYKHKDTARIEYTATIDESKLRMYEYND